MNVKHPVRRRWTYLVTGIALAFLFSPSTGRAQDPMDPCNPSVASPRASVDEINRLLRDNPSSDRFMISHKTCLEIGRDSLVAKRLYYERDPRDVCRMMGISYGAWCLGSREAVSLGELAKLEVQTREANLGERVVFVFQCRADPVWGDRCGLEGRTSLNRTEIFLAPNPTAARRIHELLQELLPGLEFETP